MITREDLRNYAEEKQRDLMEYVYSMVTDETKYGISDWLLPCFEDRWQINGNRITLIIEYDSVMKEIIGEDAVPSLTDSKREELSEEFYDSILSGVNDWGECASIPSVSIWWHPNGNSAVITVNAYEETEDKWLNVLEDYQTEKGI